MENKNKDTNDELTVNDEPLIKVYFIDFAHAIPNPGNLDNNCLESLKYLIYLLENFVEIHKKTFTETVSLPQLMLQIDAEREKIWSYFTLS